MVASSVRHPKTYEDYLATPDDGQRYELIDGEIVVSAAPLISHQRVVGRLFRLLAEISDRHGGEAFVSPTAVSLSAHNTFEPDVLYLGPGNAAVIEAGRILGVPDLVIEVLSPSNASRDQIRKRAAYQEAGVSEFWIVDPAAKMVVALGLTGGGYEAIPRSRNRIASIAVPGFVLDVNSLFAGLI